MNSEFIKIGLQRYSSLFLNPQEMLAVHIDEKTGVHTRLLWHDVAAAALSYVEKLEHHNLQLSDTPNGRQFNAVLQAKYEACVRADRLQQQNKNQSAQIERLEKELQRWKESYLRDQP